MDLRQQLQRITELLNGLSASQRMLTGCLVVIMVVTLAWWGRYAAAPELVPVLDRALAADDIGPIKAALASVGIQGRVVNDRIMVPVERQMEALSALGYAKALPSDSEDAWDTIVKQTSPWETAQKTDAMFNRAKERMLSQLIRTFPNVTGANVVINSASGRRLGGGGNLEPSASVVMVTRKDVPLPTLVDAAATTVANAVSGLKVSKISVVVNGMPQRPRDPSNVDTLGGAEQYEIIRNQEERYIEKIQSVMTIQPAVVTVAVELDPSSSEEMRETIDAKNTISKETSIETQSEETLAGSRGPGGEPGAQANMGLLAEGGGGAAGAGDGGGSTTSEKSVTKLQILPSKSVEQFKKPPRPARVARASVRLPISHFVAQYKKRNPAAAASAQEPDDAALAPLIKPELDEVKRQVLSACPAISADDVSVGVYTDVMPAMAAAVAESSSTSSGMVAGALTKYTREIAVGLLATLSLFMVSMMVKRGPQVATVAAPVELREATPLATDEDIAGEVGQGGAMLDGMELDEDTIKAQQMVEQVSTMVEENPDAAATLMKRWLNR